MFDIGFWELVIIAVVGIVVVGPDRLPEVVRTLAITLRKFRRMFSDVKADISRELDLDNMRKYLHETEIEEHIKQLNQSVIDMEDELQSPIKDAKKTVENSRQAVKDLFNDGEQDDDDNFDNDSPTYLTPDLTSDVSTTQTQNTAQTSKNASAQAMANEQADTGIEPRRPSRFDNAPTSDESIEQLVDKVFTTDETSASEKSNNDTAAVSDAEPSKDSSEHKHSPAYSSSSAQSSAKKPS